MSALVDLLTREAGLIQEFIASLNSEQEALKRGETDELAGITQKKNELVEQLNAVEMERYRFLQQSGHSGDQKGMLAWLDKHRSDRAVAHQWAKVLEFAKVARDLNNLNGSLITLRLQATNQALAALTQQSQRTTLYGRDGHTTPRTGSRIIDAA